MLHPCRPAKLFIICSECFTLGGVQQPYWCYLRRCSVPSISFYTPEKCISGLVASITSWGQHILLNTAHSLLLKWSHAKAKTKTQWKRNSSTAFHVRACGHRHLVGASDLRSCLCMLLAFCQPYPLSFIKLLESYTRKIVSLISISTEFSRASVLYWR